MTALLGLLLVAAAVFALSRRAEVRVTLLLAALALGGLAGRPDVIVRTFFAYFCREQFLLPIGTSMGFAFVLAATGCDRHLVRALLGPVRRVRPLLIPGVVLSAAVVNVPVVSQMSTAVLVGSVVVPLMLEAGFSPTTTGAALLLGSSVGGEFLNPGSPELRTVSDAARVDSALCVARAAPLLLVQLAVALPLFWVFSLRADARDRPAAPSPVGNPGTGAAAGPFNPAKAVVPLVPLVLLFLTALPPPLRAFEVPLGWLVEPASGAAPAVLQSSFESRLIGAAMLLGAAVAVLVEVASGGAAVVRRSADAFFDGVGHALTRIVALITCAITFGKGVELCGLARAFGEIVTDNPGALLPCAALLPAAFGCLCGSGMASTQSLFDFYLEPSRALGVDPVRVGAVVALGSAAGRSMSPVAAVVLTSAALSGATPYALIGRVALPLLAGMTAVVVVARLLG